MMWVNLIGMILASIPAYFAYRMVRSALQDEENDR